MVTHSKTLAGSCGHQGNGNLGTDPRKCPPQTHQQDQQGSMPGSPPSTSGLATKPLRSPREFAATSRENDDVIERHPAPKQRFQGVFRDVAGVMADGLGMKA